MDPRRYSSRDLNSRLPYHVFRYWMWEFCALVVSIGLIIGIFILLILYHDKPLSKFDEDLGIGVNTLLALLGTAFRTLILMPITSVISQSKWDWVGRDHFRPLSDIQMMDAASRGPRGAIAVLSLVSKGNLLAIVAAISSLLSLATATFIQQAARTSVCSYEELGTAVRASLPYAHFVPRTGGYNTNYAGVLRAWADSEMDLMVQLSQASPNSTESQIQASCSTGNCTFPAGDPTDDHQVSHSTIALCHHCIDVSSLLRKRGAGSGLDPFTFALPTGDFVPDSYIYLKALVHQNLTWMGELATPDLALFSNVALLNVSLLSTGAEPLATTCILYTCLRSYKSSVDETRVLENEILPPVAASVDVRNIQSFQTFNDGMPPARHHIGLKSPCRARDSQVYTLQNISSAPSGTELSLCDDGGAWGACKARTLSAPEECIYRQHGHFGDAMRASLATAFAGNCTRYRKVGCDGGPFTSTVRWLELMQSNGTLAADSPDLTFARVDRSFRTFAHDISARYRTVFGAQTYSENPEAPLPRGEVQGQAWSTKACLSSRLEWLILPAVLAVITTVLLAWMVAQSWARRDIQPAWKDSLLPLALYSETYLAKRADDKTETEDAGAAPDSTSPMEIDQLTEFAGKIQVRFNWDAGEDSTSLSENMRRKRPMQDAATESLLSTT